MDVEAPVAQAEKRQLDGAADGTRLGVRLEGRDLESGRAHWTVALLGLAFALMIAVRARDAGAEVSYDGIRQTPEEIIDQARQTGADVVGLSILSGSHLPLVREVTRRMREAGGTVRIESAPGSGTTVVFRVPLE